MEKKFFFILFLAESRKKIILQTNQKISDSTDVNIRSKDQSKVLRETKSIPKVIYELEQFRSEVISLEKKTTVCILIFPYSFLVFINWQ